MGSWEESALYSFLSAESESQVLDTMTVLAGQLGFDYCAYGLRMPIPLGNPPVAILCNYPTAWMARHDTRGYLAIDPTVRQVLRAVSPFV
ncbi:MAG: autoinducer binding domain-containing protein [Acidithiobacillus sp.]